MIKSITVSTMNNDTLYLDLFDPEESRIIIKSIDGLGPVKADISTIDFAMADGSMYSKSRVPNRNLVFSFQLLESKTRYLIEDTRLQVYKYFPVKDKVRISIKTDNYDVWIDGYVESVEPNIFDKVQTVQVSIICPNPYFIHDNDQIELSGDSSLSLTKKADIQYIGDENSGIKMKIDIYGKGMNGYFYISNSRTNKSMRIDSSKIGELMSQYSQLPYRLTMSVAIPDGDYIYTLGGSVEPKKIYRYNRKNDEWELLLDNCPVNVRAGLLFLNKVSYNAYWESVSTLPYDFYYGSAVVLSNEIHILGGYESSDRTKHYKWNGSSWISVSVLPYVFYLGSAVVLNNEIHILGGGNSETRMNHYKWNGSSWTYVSELPYDFSCYSAVVLNNEIHILGGADTQTKHYKWNGSSWISVSTLPYNFYYGSAVVLNNEIHILGGSGSGNSTKHYKWNGASWISVSTLPYGFKMGSAVVYDNKIYIIACNDVSSPYYYGHMYIWNGSSWSASTGGVNYFERSSSVLLNDGEIHILGGNKSWYSPTTEWRHEYYTLKPKEAPAYNILYSNSYYRYNTISKTWTNVGTIPITLNTLNYNHMGYAVQDNSSTTSSVYYYIIARDQSSKTTYLYKVISASNQWTKLANPPIEYRAEGQLMVIDSSNTYLYYINYSGSPNYSTYRYNVSNNTWTLLTNTYISSDIPTYSTLVYCNGEVIQLGGGNSGTAMYSFNVSTNTWSTKSVLPVHFNFGAACVDDDGAIWIMGGQYHSDNNQRIIYRYKNSTWSAIKTSIIKSGDSYTLSTVNGSKSFTGIRDGVKYNLLSALDTTTEWLDLSNGANQLTCQFVKTSGEITTDYDCYFKAFVEYSDNFKGV